MEIAVTDIPKSIKSFAFSPRVILSEKNTVEYLVRMREYIFGSKCCEAAEKLDINVYDLVFINDKAFSDCCNLYLTKLREKDKDIIRTAYMLKKMYNGEYVRISSLSFNGDETIIKDPEYAYLNMLNDMPVDSADKKKFIEKREKREKKAKKKYDLNKYAKTVLESVRLAAVKYGMKNSVQYKELIDKYNYRRFSTNLKLNNRPTDVREIEALLAKNRDKFVADLSNTKTRINFSVLFAISYGGYTLSDLYAKNTVFENTSFEKEKRLAELASDLITIIYNGNNIEIANMFIKIITTFAGIVLPPVDMKDLGSVMDNYSMYYATASLALVCENIFRYDALNGDFKQYLKKHTLENYWNFMDRIMMMKQYTDVVSFCYKLSNFDINDYREDPEYQGEILYSFEKAEKFSKELKKAEAKRS